MTLDKFKSRRTDSLLTGIKPHSTCSVAEAPIDVSITMIIPNMDTEEDFNLISSALLELKGVNSVSPLLRCKRIEINFNPIKIGLETIAHCIGMLGYRYIKRV
ncbi:hypothetical protein [Zhaonella formicivorans]|uniref:hypothetical protein n=1 Tax=Zhaonella formicivorans TaxID=2528593 RepID=UPI0010D5CE2E|nr:hypothetical protein [Zhaonella formicivorans]